MNRTFIYAAALVAFAGLVSSAEARNYHNGDRYGSSIPG